MGCHDKSCRASAQNLCCLLCPITSNVPYKVQMFTVQEVISTLDDFDEIEEDMTIVRVITDVSDDAILR